MNNFQQQNQIQQNQQQQNQQQPQYYQDQYGNVNHDMEFNPMEFQQPMQQERELPDLPDTPFYETNKFKAQVNEVREERKAKDPSLKFFEASERVHITPDLEFCQKFSQELIDTNSMFSRDSKEYKALNKANEIFQTRVQTMMQNLYIPDSTELQVMMEPLMKAAMAYKEKHDPYGGLSSRQGRRLKAISKLEAMYNHKKQGFWGVPEEGKINAAFWQNQDFCEKAKAISEKKVEGDKAAEKINLLKNSDKTTLHNLPVGENENVEPAKFNYDEELTKIERKIQHMNRVGHQPTNGEMTLIMEPLNKLISDHRITHDYYREKDVMDKLTYSRFRKFNQFTDMCDCMKEGMNMEGPTYERYKLASRLNDVTNFNAMQSLKKKGLPNEDGLNANILVNKNRKANIKALLESDTFKHIPVAEMYKLNKMNDIELIQNFGKMFRKQKG